MTHYHLRFAGHVECQVSLNEVEGRAMAKLYRRTQKDVELCLCKRWPCVADDARWAIYAGGQSS